MYLPRTLYIDGKLITWERLLKETPPETLYFTEGEFKASKASKSGLPCIGYGGVRSFSMFGSKGVDGVPPLIKGDEFRGHSAKIVYDTDTPLGLKEQVHASAQSLMYYLVERGATPALLTLPFED